MFTGFFTLHSGTSGSEKETNQQTITTAYLHSLGEEDMLNLSRDPVKSRLNPYIKLRRDDFKFFSHVSSVIFVNKPSLPHLC